MVLNRGKILILVKPNGYLDFPGGKVKFNEFLADCVVREIFEETRLNVASLKPAVGWSFLRKGTGQNIVGVTYLCNCINNAVDLSKERKAFFGVNTEDFLRVKFYPSYGVKLISQENICIWQKMTFSGAYPGKYT